MYRCGHRIGCDLDVVEDTHRALRHARTLTDSARSKRTAVTDDRGAFRFSDVVAGALELKAELSGFAVVTRSLSASAGATTTTALVMGAAGGPVPVPSPKPAAAFPARALESIVGEAALADLLRTESVGRRVLLSVVSLGERRSLFVFEQRDTSATVYELVPVVLPAEGDGLQELLDARPSMTFAGLHVPTAKSGLVVFRHGR